MARLLLGFVSPPTVRVWNLLFQRAWVIKTLVATSIMCYSVFFLSNAYATSSNQNLDHFTSSSQLAEQQKDLSSIMPTEGCPGVLKILAPFIVCHSISDLDDETLAKLEEITRDSELSNFQMLKSSLEVLQRVPDSSMVIILSDPTEDHHLHTLDGEVIGGLGTVIKCFGYACVIIGELLS